MRTWPWLASEDRSPKKTYLEKLEGIFLVHFHVHQVQQTLDFMETHPAILVLISTLEPVTQPSRCESRPKHCVCLCMQMCVPIHPLASSPLALLQVSPPCQCIFHISFQNNLVPAWLRCLQGFSYCLQKEAQIFKPRLKVFIPTAPTQLAPLQPSSTHFCFPRT